MEALKISNSQGLELSVTQDEDFSNASIISGGMDYAYPTFEEYLQDCFADKVHPHFGLIKQAIETLDWVGHTADMHANNTSFVFSDGVIIDFSWRAWGDLMSAIVGKAEGYMAYSM